MLHVVFTASFLFSAVSVVSGRQEAALEQVPAKTGPVIPAGTIIPIRLGSISSEKNRKGDVLKARVMQDVSLRNGGKIHEGATVIGHVLDVTRAVSGSQASLTLKFDIVLQHGESIPVTTNLRALASELEVRFAQIPTLSSGESEVFDWLPTVQVGGEAVYGFGGPVTNGDRVVGHAIKGGVLVNLTAKPGSKCRGAFQGNDALQSLWVFSSDACGAYGFPHLMVSHAGRTEPVGELVLTSSEGPVRIESGSGMLLRVH